MTVLSFPLNASPSMVDPPTDLRAYAVELEHEIADLQVVVAEQAVKLRSYQTPHHRWARRLRVNAAMLMAFGTGWLLDPPTVPAFALVAAIDSTPLSRPHVPGFWI
jgi:hypothetical protein